MQGTCLDTCGNGWFAIDATRACSSIKKKFYSIYLKFLLSKNAILRAQPVRVKQHSVCPAQAIELLYHPVPVPA